MRRLVKELGALAAVCDEEEREMIEEMVVNAADYVRAVVEMETKARNFAGRKGSEMLEAVAVSDSRRTGNHESLMTRVKIVNRICAAHGREPIYTGGSHRRQYGDFALELVKEIFTERH